jgi:hypothetical protein
MQRLTRIFNNGQEFNFALRALLARGYQYDEIKIKRQEGIESEEGDLIQFKNSGDAALRKSIKGLKYGLITGAIFIGTIVGLVLLFSESGTSLSPIATFITSIVVGAVWGGVLGFMLGSLFPLNSHVKEHTHRNFSLNFLPHNSEDELYFRDKWQTNF